MSKTPDLHRNAGLPRPNVPSRELAKGPEGLPPILSGHATPQLEEKVRGFYSSVATMFESWLARRKSHNTRRAYRRDVMDFVEFMGILWPSEDEPQRDESWKLLQATVPHVQAWRDYMHDERNLAPNTLNRRVSSLSGFYRFLREASAEMRLPITVPNPAHSQFIGREVQAPVSPTEALSATRARQLMALPEGEEVLAYRDRAILKFYLYTGVRVGTGCRLHVADFIDDDEDPKIRIQEKGKGKSKRPVGINVIAADALRQYIEHAELSSGPLFRPRANPRSTTLAERAMDVSTMYRILQGYLTKLPRSMKEHELPDGSVELRCLYSPHSIRATTATLLLDAGEDIRDVQKLLGHKHVTVTQVYDKRRRGTKDSASHRLAL
ncbi:MAG: tyrosine-type recombinase/integrase [Myxococcales bacterium]|nr:tyrosine-type recombinase/integrase [Myxococcales bacterium]